MTPSSSSIPGGFAKSWRKELESEVWLMAPLYHRVWYWLRMNVQYEPFLFPTRGKFGIWVLPGQRITSLQQIAEGVKWSEWGREVIPNKKSIKDILGWLESREMVTVESNAKGTLITLVKWHSYNVYDAQKVTEQSNAEVTRSGHKEERKERKDSKEEPILADFFEKLWNAYPRKDGRKEAERHFHATVKSDTDKERINLALGAYLEHIEREATLPKYIKTGKVWFNNWQDWVPEDETDAA